MAEWSKALVLKTSVRVTVPGVRIPLRPLASAVKRAELRREQLALTNALCLQFSDSLAASSLRRAA